MKRLLTNIIVAVGITGPFAATLAAQSHRAVAEIPFSFEAGSRTLAAGTYVVEEVSGGSSVFRLQDQHGKAIFAMFGATVQGNPQKPSLTFVCYGNERILAKVTPPDSYAAYSVSSATLERKRPHAIGMASMISVKLSAR